MVYLDTTWQTVRLMIDSLQRCIVICLVSEGLSEYSVAEFALGVTGYLGEMGQNLLGE